MIEDEIVTLLKEQYDRELRKQLVKTLLEDEKSGDTQSASAKILDQIFSYILKSLQWNIVHNTNEWSTLPLEILKKVFPKIEKTQWFNEKQLHTNQDIDLMLGDIKS